MRKVNFVPRFIVLLILVVTFNNQGAQLCRAALNCPANYADDTVIVSQEAVMLSEIFEHCSPDSVKEDVIDTVTDTISLFIIVDHSASMSVMDPTSTRYDVINDIIDSVYAVSPASEIGIAVFSNKLMHNRSTDPFLKTLDNSKAEDWNDAYVPLTSLNSKVSGVPAVEKLKWAISLDSKSLDPGQNYLLKNADYETSGRRQYSGGTDISLAFEAAKEAFKTASYGKNRQYILFLSDGIHQLIDVQRKSFSEDYLDGKDVPTTYTAFFINNGQPIPDPIKEMTENIQNNGYSSNNFSSKVWSTQSQEEKFLDLLFNNIIGDGLKSFTSTPKLLVINGDSTTTFDDTYAYFDAPLAALNKQGMLDVDISFTYKWDPPLNREETRNVSLVLQQGEDPDQLDNVDCWEQGVIKFYSDGDEITQATPSQKELEVRFYLSEDSTAPKLQEPVKLTLENADHSDALELKLHLDASKKYYYSSFIREYGESKDDGKLQNLETDSIIARYQNPQIPLDTTSSAILVLPLIDMTITNACYRDLDANGHPDIISVYQKGGELLTSNDCNLITPFSSIISPRDVGVPNYITPESYGFSVSIDQKSEKEEGKTDSYLSSDSKNSEYFKVNYQGKEELSSLNELPYFEDIISDSMAPVINSAIYIDLQSSDAEDTLKIVFSEQTSSIVSFNPFNIISGNGTTTFTPDLKFVKTEGNTSFFAIVPGGKNPPISAGDSIWINTAGAVSDLTGNVQLNEDNVKREINYVFDMTISSACYRDLDANGHPDIISIYQKNGKVLTPNDCDVIKPFSSISSPREVGEPNFITPESYGFSVAINQKSSNEEGKTDIYTSSSLSNNEFFTVEYDGNTELSSKNDLPFFTDSISDSMAPVINSATYIDLHSPLAADTLKVIFSEQTSAIENQHPFKFMQPGNTTFTVDIKFVKTAGDTSIFAVVPGAGTPPVSSGDSIWINSTGEVSDLSGNLQLNENNIKRELHYISAISILSAAYFDNSSTSDGLIDQISIKTDKTIDSTTAAEVVSQMSLNENREFTIHGFTLFDDGFSVMVSQPEEMLPITSTDALDIINLPTLFTEVQTALFTTEVTIIDSLPPVLTSASFMAAFKTEKSQNVYDTLSVVFSEAVEPAPYVTNEPFDLICGVGDTSYAMTLELISNSSDKKSSLFSVTAKTKSYPQSSDSVKIKAISTIQDLQGIVQANDSNRLVPLDVSNNGFFIKVAVANNPGKLTDNFTINGTTFTGIGIKADILGSGWPEGVHMTGHCRILDVVGNEIAILDGIAMDDRSGFWFIWDGMNKNERIIRCSPFLGVVTIINETEISSAQETVVIGIKEER